MKDAADRAARDQGESYHELGMEEAKTVKKALQDQIQELEAQIEEGKLSTKERDEAMKTENESPSRSDPGA